QMEDGIFFNQSKYIKEMLKKFGLKDSKLMKTPMSSDTKLTKDKELSAFVPASKRLPKPITLKRLNIELSKEFLIELKNNAYHGMFDEDVVYDIAKVLELLDLIEISGVDSHRLRMKVFPLSLADDARQWWINEGEGKITT
ncbi:hypothetical protein Tco_1009728, partial [Tanacetum coccineum]